MCPATVLASDRVPAFLRWAGGKRWLLPQIPAVLGDVKVRNYYEPFLGGGSVFLSVSVTGTAFLSDLNADLIETYVQVRDEPSKVATALSRYKNEIDHYYRARGQTPSDPAERAARFIYLNHTSFNGIYRVNLQGEYNVPFGNRESPKIPTHEHLKAVSTRLRGAALEANDFEAAIAKAGKHDLVFLDPPYTVAHDNNGFVKYNQKLFSFADQERLRDAIDRLRKRGAYYILTNAAHKSISELFDFGETRLKLTRRNSIGGKKAARGSASEYLFTNLGCNG